MTESAFLTVHELAIAIGLSEGRVYALIAEGEIPTLRVGRRIRVPRAAFDRWLEQQAQLALDSLRTPVGASAR